MNADARLLVVDDTENNVDLLVRRLQRFGYRDILTAGTGRAAIELIRTESVDLVLLDIIMPDLDGYAVLQYLRDEGLLTALPVIMVSALDDMDNIVRCIELGAEDYLTKPFNTTLLRARVSAVLEKKRLRDVSEAHLRRLEQEAGAARELQLGLLATDFPTATDAAPVSLHAVMHPAMEVGGDLYDFFYPDEHTLCCMVGDVAGKGVASGLFMARARSLLRWVTAHATGQDDRPDLARIAATVNAELCEGNAMVMFVTVCIALLDLRTGALEVCSAGHNPPYLVHASGAVEELGVHADAALGIHDDAEYRTRSAQLHPGDSLFIYTDGITEARNEDGEFYTEQRLEAALTGAAALEAERCIEAVVSGVSEFAGAAPQADDITALMLRWHGRA